MAKMTTIAEMIATTKIQGAIPSPSALEDCSPVTVLAFVSEVKGLELEVVEEEEGDVEVVPSSAVVNVSGT